MSGPYVSPDVPTESENSMFCTLAAPSGGVQPAKTQQQPDPQTDPAAEPAAEPEQQSQILPANIAPEVSIQSAYHTCTLCICISIVMK